MAKAKLWKTFRRRFEDLQATEESCAGQLGAEVLKALYYPDGLAFIARGVSASGIPGRWEIFVLGIPGVPRPRALQLAREFELIAGRAAVAAGCPDREESWVYWLNAMRQTKVFFGAEVWFAPPVEAGGPPIEAAPGSQGSFRLEIFREICERSADFCQFLASGTEFPLVGESAGEENQGEACTWGQIEIRFVDSDSVRVKAKGRSLGRKTFAEMGFTDRRSGRTDKSEISPQKAWLLLELIARKGELIAPPRSSSKAEESSTERKLIQKTRRMLRTKLKSLGYVIPGNSDPLPCRDGKWRAAFTLTHDEKNRP